MCCSKKFPIFELQSVKNLLTRGARTTTSLFEDERKARGTRDVPRLEVKLGSLTNDHGDVEDDA